MRVLRVRNVCEALAAGISLLRREGTVETSRAGHVLVANEPVTTVYSHPTERVLFSPGRDANPFFHLVEAVWMLAGRNDAAQLTPYVKRFAEFAEPGGRVHGAYGYRWRNHFGYDQLGEVVRRLTDNPHDRQAVIAMWDAMANDYGGGDDLADLTWKDRPCNTHIYLRVHSGRLDMQVNCRSNDIIWGAYGANAVHFSVLLEYLAARIGVAVGRLYQVSWNYHAYLAVLDPLIEKCRGEEGGWFYHLSDNRYTRSGAVVDPLPIGDPLTLEGELEGFWYRVNRVHDGVTDVLPSGFATPLLQDAWLAVLAHASYRRKEFAEAIEIASKMRAPDWRVACVEWLERRRS